MKLKIGNKVYLQKYEVAHFFHQSNSLPVNILQETFKNDDCYYGPTSDFRFEYVYKDPENVKWLMEQDWIVDFDEYNEMPLAELGALKNQLKAECSANVDTFNANVATYRDMHFDEESAKFDKLRHKIASLEKLIKYRKGEIKFVLPTKKKPSFFARLFGRCAQ